MVAIAARWLFKARQNLDIIYCDLKYRQFNIFQFEKGWLPRIQLDELFTIGVEHLNLLDFIGANSNAGPLDFEPWFFQYFFYSYKREQ